ncbi:transcription-repair coupling factor [Thermodesulfatator atlanticus]|uniref:transcription-repair coupling factor n=1 Tax=Thermodesulfatator atlanticus TaxID=501497 RepID=UPI0003B74931|nr:transcription-repair coupling factor [Thermodesulfatator atlanticus]
MPLTGNKFAEINAFLERKEGLLKIGGLTVEALALLLNLTKAPRGLIVLPKEEQVERIKQAVEFFGGPKTFHFLGGDTPPFSSIYQGPGVSGERIAALYHFLEKKEGFLVVSAKGLVRRTIPPQVLKESYEYILCGEEIPREKLIRQLINLGYEKTGLVQKLGEFTVRGSVIDIFTPGYPYPIRLDFFGEELESIKFFNPETQRSLKTTEEAVILPVREILFEADRQGLEERLFTRLKNYALAPDKESAYLRTLETGLLLDPEEFWLPLAYEKPASIFDYLKKDDLVIVFEPGKLIEHLSILEEKLLLSWRKARDGKRILVEPFESFLAKEEITQRLTSHPKRLTISRLPLTDADISFDVQDHEEHVRTLKREPRKAIEIGLSYLKDRLHQERVVILSTNEKAAEKIRTLVSRELHANDIPLKKPPFEDLKTPFELALYTGNLARGFSWPELSLCFLPEHELFGVRKPLFLKKRASLKDTLLRFEDLKPGDYVVHREHGIGRYQGLVSLELGGLPGEFLLIEYKGGDKLYLPVDKLNLLHKYVGIEGKEPALDRLGGKSFETRKRKVQKAIEEVAQELLSLYAARKVSQGFAFEPGPLLRQLEASFPFEETPEQALAIEETLADMQKPAPMDRLICGDVGYGKTEVALRAAALAVENKKQVAILVPTTVLAEQHFRTFSERFSPLGVKVAVISRFKTPKEQKEILKKLAQGEIDIIIGTHRLLSNDVSFKDLGLLIIDEEHRFGVKHKEKLKQLRQNVDVLALSATPIPRTLQLSLLGIRDLSVITTPPEERLPVKTYLARFDDEVIKEAIERELARGGQVFFVHNRIKGIYALADWLRRLVPQARIEVAHGRTPPQKLEEIMVKFVRHEIDVLVCTTIVESGIDIPSANTIIINRADRMGLAEIYQLRGRVGRRNVQAYAYLLVPSLSGLSEEAERRLKALMQFSELGAGFKLAMSDLQIRGAGNLLGTFQSGHVAAVGYDLYLDILKQTIDEIRGKPLDETIEPDVNLKIPAYFPPGYVPDVEQRLHLYRRLALARDEETVDELAREIEDRFGAFTPEVENLIKLSYLKVLLRPLRVRKLDRRGREIIFFFDPSADVPESALRKEAKKRGLNLRITKDKRVIMALDPQNFLDELLSFLFQFHRSLKMEGEKLS